MALYLTLLTLLDSTMPLLGSTWLYHSLPWLNLIPLDSTNFYHGSTSLYLTLLHSTMAPLGCIMALLGSTWLYHTLPWLWLAVLHSLLGCTWLCSYTLPCLTMALLMTSQNYLLKCSSPQLRTERDWPKSIQLGPQAQTWKMSVISICNLPKAYDWNYHRYLSHTPITFLIGESARAGTRTNISTCFICL